MKEAITRRDNGEVRRPSSARTADDSASLPRTVSVCIFYEKSKAEVNRNIQGFKRQWKSGTYREIQKQTVEEYITDWLITYKKIERKLKSYDTLVSTGCACIFGKKNAAAGNSGAEDTWEELT